MMAMADSSVFLTSTSDRVAFKRCRRKWYWTSKHGLNLIPIEAINPNLWFGSAFHFALEDYHGLNEFGTPERAFAAFIDAHHYVDLPLPENVVELQALATGMLSYYTQHWLSRRPALDTLIINDIPQTEVYFEIPYEIATGISCMYRGKFDRLALDGYGRLWVCEYKTAAQIDTAKLETDQQINAYAWAASVLYPQYTFEGIQYYQFRKAVPELPRVLKDGSLSRDKSQRTTHHLYRQELLDRFGSVPLEYVDTLNTFAAMESEEGDQYIRRDPVRRYDANIKAEYDKLVAESYDMATAMRIYPNGTRDCAWDCPFRIPCIAMDSDLDYKYVLESMYRKATEADIDPWLPAKQYIREKWTLPSGITLAQAKAVPMRPMGVK